MTINEAASRVLSILEQTDEEEYDLSQATMDINQAIAEIAGDGELSSYNSFSQYVIDTDSLDGNPDWAVVPGRVDMTTALSSTSGRIGYIKKIWLDSDGNNIDFSGARVDYLLSKYGDDEGQPAQYAVDGGKLYWRPVGASGASYTARIWWAEIPPEYGAGEEPALLAKAPYAVIYRACSLGALWLVDDQAALKYDKKSQLLIDKYIVQDSMHNDDRVTMEDFNG